MHVCHIEFQIKRKKRINVKRLVINNIGFLILKNHVFVDQIIPLNVP